MPYILIKSNDIPMPLPPGTLERSLVEQSPGAVPCGEPLGVVIHECEDQQEGQEKIKNDNDARWRS